MKCFQSIATAFAFSTIMANSLLPASAQEVTITAATDGQYDYVSHFPAELSGMGFRMPKQDFLALIAEKGWSYKTNANQNVFLVSVPDAPFTDIMVRMNSNAGEFLTEIEIQFADEAAAKMYFSEHYSPVNSSGDFQAYDPVEAYRTKAWQFSNKIFYVGVIMNTRWSNQ